MGDNTRFVRDSIQDLLKLVEAYSKLLASDAQPLSWEGRNAEINRLLEEADVDFLKEEIPRAIEQTLEGVDRVAEIIRSMKEFSHPGGEEKSPIDISRAIESTATVCKHHWKYVADMETDFQGSLPLVPCLVGEFNQVILNLIVNAADAIGEKRGESGAEKGRIAISTRLDDPFVEIRISDTGGGVPEEIQHKIFDPFFTTKEVGKGTGQGLAICHDVIVNKHGGALVVETDPGVGSTFIIRLPIQIKANIESQVA